MNPFPSHRTSLWYFVLSKQSSLIIYQINNVLDFFRCFPQHMLYVISSDPPHKKLHLETTNLAVAPNRYHVSDEQPSEVNRPRQKKIEINGSTYKTNGVKRSMTGDSYQ